MTMKKNKENKTKYIDDGHTIYNMNVDGMPSRRGIKKDSNISLTRKEKNAMIKATLAHFLPIVLLTILCFVITMLLLYLWLS